MDGFSSPQPNNGAPVTMNYLSPGSPAKTGPKSQRSANRAGSGAASPTRSRLMMGKLATPYPNPSADTMEKDLIAKLAKTEYEQQLHELEDAHATQKDIEEFKKAQLLQKSMNEVKKRAQEQDRIRHSPSRYKQVKSKVSRCLKVQKKAKYQTMGGRTQSEYIHHEGQSAHSGYPHTMNFGDSECASPRLKAR